jgi:hypothetical protein
MKREMLRLAPDQFVTLILDNEVTVGEFVTNPAVSWTRLIQRDGVFEVAEGYPTVLTASQAKFEMRNWDAVSLRDIVRVLEQVDESIDYILFGNNAGQGLPLAKSLPANLVADRAAIIYANSLPEIDFYKKLGYRTFLRRREVASRLLEMAHSTGRSLALCFINTIQHNEFNYHDP